MYSHVSKSYLRLCQHSGVTNEVIKINLKPSNHGGKGNKFLTKIQLLEFMTDIT